MSERVHPCWATQFARPFCETMLFWKVDIPTTISNGRQLENATKSLRFSVQVVQESQEAQECAVRLTHTKQFLDRKRQQKHIYSTSLIQTLKTPT